jgi:hypothetical protein
MKFSKEKEILPAFPRTPHLPHKPNLDETDRVADDKEASVLFTNSICVEEKIDGASCGMVLYDREPIIRNRDHILRKGYYKATAAKMQFASVWGWFYDNKNKFQEIAELGPYSVYGEWCVAQHGIYYDSLPDWFIAYDLYDYEQHCFLPSPRARVLLLEAGFIVPHCHFDGLFSGDCDELEAWANSQSAWAVGKAEGIYVKAYNEDVVTHRFKMVRADFQRGALWKPKILNKNMRSRPSPE